MVRRALKLVSLVSGAGAIAGLYMHSNKHLDPNDFGVVRVGRAVATTAVIAFDYLTSLRNFPRGTEEYDYVKSQIPILPVSSLCSYDHSRWPRCANIQEIGKKAKDISQKDSFVGGYFHIQ